VTPSERMMILRRNQGQCLGCAAAAQEADHFKPRHAGGPGSWYNLLPLCSSCNKIKSCLWPGHGYHPIPGYDDLDRALNILSAEITFQVAAYGERTLLAVLSWGCLSPDAPALRAIENCCQVGRPGQYASASDALRAELGASPDLVPYGPRPTRAFGGTWGYRLLRDAMAGRLQWTKPCAYGLKVAAADDTFMRKLAAKTGGAAIKAPPEADYGTPDEGGW
jgi:hypothetical protein